MRRILIRSIILLLAVACEDGLATYYTNASGSTVTEEARWIGSGNSVKSSAGAGEGCMARVYPMTQFNWVPFHGLHSEPHVLTNSADVLTTTAEFYTGGHNKDGQWTMLKGVSTLTFPTGLSIMFPGYDFRSTSGTSSGSVHFVSLSTVIPFPPPSSVLPSWVSTESGQRTRWRLTSTTATPLPSQISWFRSLYPRESALQQCPIGVFFQVQLPPGVAIVGTLIEATAAESATLANTWETFGHASKTATPTLTISDGHDSQHHPGATPVPVSIRPTGPNTAHRTFVTDEPASESHVEGKTKQPAVTVRTSVNGADARTAFNIGSMTLAQGGAPSVESSTTYSLPSIETAIIASGQTSVLDQTTQTKSDVASTSPARVTSIAAPQPPPGLSITTISGSEILVNGRKLAMNTTLTLGSGAGSVVTRVALATNTAGETFLVGDSITRAPGTSCVGRCSEIKGSLQATSANVQLTPKGGIIASSSTAANGALHAVTFSKVAYVIATAYLLLFALHMAG